MALVFTAMYKSLLRSEQKQNETNVRGMTSAVEVKASNIIVDPGAFVGFFFIGTLTLLAQGLYYNEPEAGLQASCIPTTLHEKVHV